MINVDDINAFYAEEDERKRRAQSATIYQGVQTPQPAAAKAVQHGNTLGLPPGFVLLDPQENELLAKAKTIRDNTKYSPVLADWMADKPLNTSLAQNDTHNLAGIEQSFGTPELREWNPSFLQKTRMWLDNLFGLPERERARAMNAYAEQRSGVTAGEARDSFGGMSELPGQAASKFMHGATFGVVPDMEGAPTTAAGTVGAAGGSLAGFIAGPAALAEKGVAAMGVSALERNAKDTFVKALAKEVGKGSLVLGGASALSEVGDAMNSSDVGEFLKKEGEAALHGAETGAVFGAAGRVLPKDEFSHFLGRAVANSVALDALNGTNPVETIKNWDTMTPQQQVDALFNYGLNTLFSARGGGRLMTKAEREAGKADEAIQLRAQLEQASQHAQASELRENAPDHFKQVVKLMADGKPVENLYIDAKALADAMDAHGIKPDELLARMPEVAGQMKEALEIGGDVRIPTADYLTHLAGSKIEPTILDEVKLRPGEDGATYKQALDAKAKEAETMKEQVVQLAKTVEEQTTRRQQHEALMNAIRQELDATKRQGAAANKVQASIQASIAMRLAEQSGMKPDEFWKQYGTTVRGEGVAGGLMQGVERPFDFSLPADGNAIRDVKIGNTTVSLDVNANTKDVTVASVRTPQAKRGAGSARAAMDALVRQADADGVTLKLAASPLDKKTNPGKLVAFYRSLGFEPTGRSANAAGDPEMIRKPSAGGHDASPVHALVGRDAPNPGSTEGATHLDVDGVQRPALNSKGQPIHSTEEGVRNFWRWFGDSKVVDAEGRPLVVYHGTYYANAIDAFDTGKGNGMVWTTSQPSYASEFTGRNSGAVYPLYVRLENPFNASKFTGERSVGYWRKKLRDAGVDVSAIDWGVVDFAPEYGSKYNFYDLFPHAGNNEAKSGALNAIQAAGFDGLIAPAEEGMAKKGGLNYVAFDPAQIKSATGNSGEFDPNNPSILKQGGDAVRGQYAPDTREIALLKDANLTTYLHETGHWALDVMGRMASREDAPPAIREDFDKIMRWFGVDAEKWAGMSLDEQRPYHEKFAEGFEKYLMEGKAPSLELQPAFQRIKQWFLSVYKDLRNLGADLTPEVRGVFDRLLASDDAIKEAEAARGLALPDTKPEYISDEDWTLLKQQHDDAIAAAADNVAARKVRDVQWLNNATSKKLRELQKQADAIREGIRKEVTEQVDAMPVYRAKAWLDEFGAQSGVNRDAAKEWRDAEAAQRSSAAEQAKAEYLSRPEAEGLKGIQKGQYLAKGKKEMALEVERRMLEWGKDNPKPKGEKVPVDMEIVAETFGFQSGAELKKALAEAQPRDVMIEGLTDQRMLEEHGELSTPAALQDAANAALSGPASARFLATGLKVLTKSPVSSRTLEKGAKEAADAAIGAKKVGEVNPRQYEAQQAKAAKEKLKAWNELADPDTVARTVQTRTAGKYVKDYLAEKFPEKEGVTYPESVLAAARAIAEAEAQPIAHAKAEEARARAQAKLDERGARTPEEVAVRLQRAELLNSALARSARQAVTDIEKFLDWVKRYDKDSIRLKIDVDIRDQIDDLLERFDFRKNPPDPTQPTKDRVRLQDWMAAQQAAGYEPMVSAAMLDDRVAMPYREMTVDQMRALRDTVSSLEKIGRERQHVTLDGKRMTVEDAVAPMVEKMRERGEKFTDAQIAERPRYGVDPTWRVAWDRISSFMRAAVSEFTRPDYKGNKWDLHEILGPAQRAIVEPLLSAAYRYGDMLDEVGRVKRQRMAEYGLDRDWQDTLNDVVANHGLMDNSLETPSKRRLTRGDLIGIAAHVGNESNFEKLTKGMGWDGRAVWDALHLNLAEKDWNAARLLGELAGLKGDDVFAMNRRLGNDNPDRIEPRPFMTKYGEMPGWYMPIKYDPIRSKLSAKKDAERAVNPGEALFDAGYFKSNYTSNGSLNARQAGYYDFIDLNWRNIEKHIQDSLRDLAYRETLIDTHKIYRDKDFKRQFQRTFGPEEYKHLGDWLGRLVNGEVGDEKQSKLVAIVAASRRAMVANGVAFRISTMLKHGGSAGAKSVGWLAGGGEKYFAKRIAQMATNHSNEVAEAIAKFPEIRQRLRQQDRDFGQAVGSIFEPESLHGKAERFGHAGVAALDFLTAVPTAHAAYDWAITEGIPKRLGGTGEPMSEADAIKFASKMVREAHGSTNEAGQSLLINNKSEIVKGLTMLHGFMNNAFGQNADAVDKAFHAEGFGKPELFARMFMAQLVPGIMAGWVTFGGPNEDENWLGWAFHHIGGEFAGLVPMVREGASFLEGRKDAAVPPWMRALADTFKVGEDVAKKAQGEETKHAIKDTGNAAGLWLPGLGQLGASSQFLYDVAKGDQQPETVGEWLRGLMSGHAKPAH